MISWYLPASKGSCKLSIVIAKMDPFETQSSQPESNNFDNDFEKLDPFGVPGDDDQLVSSSIQRDTPEEDLYSGSPAMNASEAEPLVSFDDPTPVAPAPQPVAQPDSSVPKFQEEFVEEPPAPAPVKKAEKPAAPSAPSASSTCCSAGAWLKSIDPRDMHGKTFLRNSFDDLTRSFQRR